MKNKHKWDDAGERCVICGDKDWMGTLCEEKPVVRDSDFIVSCLANEITSSMLPLIKKCIHQRLKQFLPLIKEGLKDDSV